MGAANTELDLTRDFRHIARLWSEGETIDEIIRRGLDWIARVAPYDLATLFELDGDRLVVRAARGGCERRGAKARHFADGLPDGARGARVSTSASLHRGRPRARRRRPVRRSVGSRGGARVHGGSAGVG